MDLYILDTELNPVHIVDNHEAIVWTERYNQVGDFELVMTMSNEVLSYLKQDYYVQKQGSDSAMIIEKIRIKTSSDGGNKVTVTGQSLESILKRRIVWGQREVRGNLQNGVKALITDCIINPTDIRRKINNFIFEDSTDPVITDLRIEAQYTGDNLYDVIEKICTTMQIGFKVTLNENKEFVFRLYSGVDRSYDQLVNPYVVFSPRFENIINSNYIESKMTLKNVTLIAGEGEGSLRKYASTGFELSGLQRRELFTDARDISSDIGNDMTLTDDEYYDLLFQRGHEKLSETIEVTSFEGQVETSLMFQYGVDFFNGDIVQIENEYGHTAKARIIEVITSEDREGFSVFPTFEMIIEGGV